MAPKSTRLEEVADEKQMEVQQSIEGEGDAGKLAEELNKVSSCAR